MALVQDHLKRLLAFVTISQIGLALAGIGLLTPEGGAGASLLILSDGLLRAGLFVCLGAVLHRCGSLYQSRLYGRGAVLPRAVPILFVAGTLGLAALPPLGAFPGKALIDEAAAEVGYGWVSAVFLLVTVLTTTALLRAGARIFFGWGPALPAPTDPRESAVEESELVGSRGRVPGVMFASAAILIVGGLTVSAVPGVITEAQRGAHAFADRAAYAAAVLGRPVPAAEPFEYLHPGTVEVVLSLVGVLAAVGLTAVLVERWRLPFAVPRSLQWAARTTSWRLRRQHSGQIGDYVAWATVGFAVLGGLFAVVT
jgi:multicomponent Na+:H+ antiporter subunit D